MILFEKNGRLLLGIGSLGMITFSSIFFIINLLTDLNQLSGIDLHAFNITLTASTLGTNGWFLSSVISGISGLIGVKGYTDLSESEQKKDLRYTWGVFGIVLGIVGGTIGGGIILVAGIFLMISYFKE
ncbi:MAG: hypothetical protein ACW98I_14880 [Candidatus Hodarchaeales archaeon]|jgi:hypothetical protein